MSTDSRLELATAWHARLGSRAPAWEDVEVVARLDLRDRALAEQLLFIDRSSLLARWDELVAALAAATLEEPAPVTAPVAPDPTVAATAPRRAHRPAPEPAPEPDVERFSGAGAVRLAALTSWLKDRTSAGDEVDVTEDDLVEIAEKNPTSSAELKLFRQSVRDRSAELWKVLKDLPHGDDALVAEQATVQDLVAVAERSAQPEPAFAPTEDITAPPRTGPTELIDFERFPFTNEPAGVEVLEVGFTAEGDERLRFSWLLHDGLEQVVIYSVRTSNEFDSAMSFRLGEPVGSTFDSTLDDDQPFTGAVRYVAVWRSVGGTEAEARTALPALHAKGVCVLPVRSCTVREDEGSVIGRWQAISGVQRIDVLRVPQSEAARTTHYIDAFRIPADKVTTGGFEDDGAQPGSSYEYRVYAVSSIEGRGELFSPYVARSVQLNASVQPVSDLAVVAQDEDESRFDLFWTPPPLGTVEVYRSETPFPSGIDQAPIERAALERVGITPNQRIDRGRSMAADSRTVIRDVPWPSGWSRAYFTPVTVLNDQLCMVGTSRTLVKPTPVADVRLIERVDEQFLTFAWPVGSPTVNIYRSAVGVELRDPGTEVPIHELSEESYRRYGGAHLEQQLPADGCSVHVVGVTWVKGHATYADPVTVDYPGLTRVSYRIVPAEAPKGIRGVARSTRQLQVKVSSPSSPSGLPFTLVFHPDRLPLRPGEPDGLVIGNATVDLLAGREVDLAVPFALNGRAGYLRLFSAVGREHAHRIAVLDPPLSQLRVGPVGQGGPR